MYSWDTENWRLPEDNPSPFQWLAVQGVPFNGDEISHLAHRIFGAPCWPHAGHPNAHISLEFKDKGGHGNHILMEHIKYDCNELVGSGRYKRGGDIDAMADQIMANWIIEKGLGFPFYKQLLAEGRSRMGGAQCTVS